MNLLKKEYPPTVRTRPILWISGVLIVLIMAAMLVVSTIASIKKKQAHTVEENTAVKQLSHEGDMQWYKKHPHDAPAIIAPEEPQITEIKTIEVSGEVPSTTVFAQPAQPQFVPVPTNTAPVKPEPYSTPINSNQLTGDQFYRQHEGGSGGSMQGGENSPSGLQQSQKDAFLQAARQGESPYLPSMLMNPISPYEIKAGGIIPAILITGINSDLPGQIVAQVKSPVYDTVAGRYLLIPQGARLIGLYDSQVAYGQERVLVAWKRIIFPDGKSMDLGGMPGVDLSGYAGVKDKVNNHYGKIFGSVVLMSMLSAGAQLSQPQQSADNDSSPSVNQLLAQSLGTNIANAGTTLLNKNLGIAPTLEIRPGSHINVSVTKDMVFPSPYGQGM